MSKSLPSSPFKRLLTYGHNYHRQIYLAATCSVLNKLFDLAPPALIGAAVDVVIKQQDSLIAQLGIKDVFQQLLILTLLSMIVWGLESVFEYAYQQLWRNLAQSLQHDLRLDAYEHLQNLELSYFEERSSGELLAILNDDVNQLERFLDIGANEILQVLTTVIIIGGVFFILTPNTAWMAILPIPFILWGSLKFQTYLAPLYGKVRAKVSELNGQLGNNLGGITTIKSFTTETYEIERIRQKSEAYRQSNRQAIRVSAAFVPLIRLVILAGFTAILLYGGMEVIEGKLAVGTYSVLVFLTQRLLWPLTRLGQTLDLYQRAMASTHRVFNLLDTPITIHSGTVNLSAQQVQGNIEINNVTFAYQTSLPILKDISLTIPSGQTIAIVGATGSGKSTLIKLLLRFYEIQSGNITLDGIDLKEINLADLRKNIGLVSQEVYLFHGSIQENIAYGTLDVSFNEMITAAKLAEAHQFIEKLPNGYDTIVGERGQKLSGGQRQRLSIARALLKNPPILIFDEATSAVDNETEAAIARSLETITQNRTTIMIAHRLSTIRHADWIYVLDGGQIIEQGTHEKLLEREGVYSNLWRVQTGEKYPTITSP